MQRCVFVVVDGLQLTAVFLQELDDEDVPVPRRQVQGSLAVVAPGVHLGTFLDQKLNNCLVTILIDKLFSSSLIPFLSLFLSSLSSSTIQRQTPGTPWA
jgi:hypothetical protein